MTQTKIKIDKDELLRHLRADLKSAETMQKEWLGKRAVYINETYGKPYGNEVSGKSAIVSKDIKKQLEWQLPTLADPFLSTPDVIKCHPVTAEDTLAARQNELLLNTQFCRKFPRYNFIMKALRVLATEGTVIIRTGWDYEDKEVEEEVETVAVDDLGNEYITRVVATVTKVVKNQPTAVVCRNEDIFIDPTCMDDMDKCQFVVHRFETDMSTLKADGRYKNLDKIANINSTSSSWSDGDYRPEDSTNFMFRDDARKKILVYEYWGNYDVNGDGIVEPIVCAWVNNTIIRLQSNPYPDGKPPFIVVPYNAVPFQLFGEALAENIGDNQKVKTAITRGIIDNMARSNNAQVGIRKGALDGTNKKRFLNGDNFEFNGTPADFWQGSYNVIPGSVFDMLQLMNNEIESQTGVKSFSGGITGNSLGATATAARGALDATATRRLNLVRNVAENMIKPLMRKWMVYNSEFLEEEEIVRVTNEEYVPIRKDDLAGNIDIDISISTAEDNAARIQELSFLLQTMGPNLNFELNQILMAEIARLSRSPELEKQIRDFKPQQDPVQEQRKQLELAKLLLELELMKADIADKQMRTAENDVDRVVKLAKAKREEAAARKLNADSDLQDLQFLMKDGGIDTEVDLAKMLKSKELDMIEKERDRQHQLELVKIQAMNKDRNIGVG